MPDELAQLVRFARRLREEGVGVGTGAIEDYCRAAVLVGPEGLYWAGRATLVGRREEIPVYDRVFRGFFFGGLESQQARARRQVIVVPVVEAPEDGFDAKEESAVGGVASAAERLRHKSFDECTREELAQLAELAGTFARSLPVRSSRRRRRADDGVLDVPRTLRRALRTGGEPFERRFRTRTDVPRRLVLLLDVSNSMSGFSRGPLVLAHALLRARPHTEVFCFATRLTRITRALALRDPDEALARAAEEVVDWDGGTRIGDSVKAFLSHDVVRGAVVLICSDGLDVGDPEVLRVQMERLARLAHRVVWLNPLKRDDAYEPLAQGMAAALPFVDVFAAGHNVASLEATARQL